MQCDAVWIYQLVSLPERIDRLQTYIRSCYSAQPTLCSSPFCAIEYLTLVWTINIQSASNFLGNDTNNISRTIEAWRSDIQRRPCNCWISKLNFSWPPHSLLILMSEVMKELARFSSLIRDGNMRVWVRVLLSFLVSFLKLGFWKIIKYLNLYS